MTALLFATCFIMGTVLMVPGAILTAAAGALFGPVRGTIAVVTLGLVADAIVLHLSRTIAGNRVRRLSAQHAWARDCLDGVERHAFAVVCTLRLAPVPYNVVTWLLGATRIPRRTAVLASAVGGLPGTVACVTAGAGVDAWVVGEGAVPVAHILALMVSVVSCTLLARAAGRWLSTRNADAQR